MIVPTLVRTHLRHQGVVSVAVVVVVLMGGVTVPVTVIVRGDGGGISI